MIKMVKIFDVDEDIHKVKLKRKERYNDEIRGFGGVSTDGYLLGSMGGHGLNHIDELEEKEVRLILEVLNTEEMKRMLNPKSKLERRIEDEIERRMNSKGLTAKLERELTEKEFDKVRELTEIIEKELEEEEKEELRIWRDRKLKLQKTTHEKLKGNWRDLTE